MKKLKTTMMLAIAALVANISFAQTGNMSKEKTVEVAVQ